MSVHLQIPLNERTYNLRFPMIDQPILLPYVLTFNQQYTDFLQNIPSHLQIRQAARSGIPDHVV